VSARGASELGAALPRDHEEISLGGAATQWHPCNEGHAHATRGVRRDDPAVDPRLMDRANAVTSRARAEFQDWRSGQKAFVNNVRRALPCLSLGARADTVHGQSKSRAVQGNANVTR